MKISSHLFCLMPFVDKKKKSKKKHFKTPKSSLKKHNNDSERNFSDILKSNTFVSSNDKRNKLTHKRTHTHTTFLFLCFYLL